MIQKLKRMVLIAITPLLIGMPAGFAMGGVALAADAGCSDVAGNINQGANVAFGNSGCSAPASGTNSLASIAKTVVNVFSLIVGLAAVIMIIYGGLRYITSGGDSGSVGNAKNTIIYALVGLLIVALAQTIVHFVLNAALNNTVTTT